jgi:hypothetical protein
MNVELNCSRFSVAKCEAGFRTEWLLRLPFVRNPEPTWIDMASNVLSEAQLKEAIKAALVEVLEERGDLIRAALAEAIEEVALVHAIREGETSEPIAREEVFRTLGSGS